jgi:threonine dehydrogenase-like Zn-dependent dehydrogenase
MWIIGKPADTLSYQFSKGLDAPETIVLTDVPESVKKLTEDTGAHLIEKNNLGPDDYSKISSELTEGKGFDDIVLLNPQSAKMVGEISKLIARRGTLNMVGQTSLDDLVDADVGRLHYDYIAFLGNQGPDIAASYGEARNRCELKAGGVAVFIGAGGPMGQMHVQRALEMSDGPKVLIATEINEDRLDTLRQKFLPLAEKNKCELHVVNPNNLTGGLDGLVKEVSGGLGADDVVVSVPSARLMAESAALMNLDGMMVLFAGVPNGTLAPLNLSNVYMHNAQFTGTSGLTIDDQGMVLTKTDQGKLSPGRMVAAIGGMNTAIDALEGVINNTYPGKIVIFPQIQNLPLIGLDELQEKLPEVAEKLGPGNVWTIEAEAKLIEKYWQP